MKLTIEELAEKFNNLPTSLEYKTTDKRLKTEISVRRIQTYITQGLLDRPIKEGNRAYFNESHLEKLILLRQYTMSGLSDNSLKNIELLSSQYEENDSQTEIKSKDDNLKNEALKAILDINSSMSNKGGNDNSHYSNNTKNFAINTQSRLLVSNIGTQLSKTTRNWQEVQVDNEGSVFLKIESGKVLDKKEVLKNIEKFLNIGDKNDKN